MFAVSPSPTTRPPLLTARKTQPPLTPAAVVHSSIQLLTQLLTQLGTGIVGGVFPSPGCRRSPTGFALLDLFDCQSDQLVAPQAAADEESEDRAIALAFAGLNIGQG
jgi:hypothetical protein